MVQIRIFIDHNHLWKENTRAGYKIMKTRGCNSVDSKHPSRLQNGFMKCKRKEWMKLRFDLIQAASNYLYANHVVTWMLLGTLWPLCKTPFRYENTTRTLRANCDDWFINFQPKKIISYHKHVHHNLGI